MMATHMIRYANSLLLYRTLFNGLPLLLVIFVLEATMVRAILSIHRLLNLFWAAWC